MVKTAFTPGPWYVTEAAEDLGYYRIREEASDYVLATTDDGGHPDPKFALPPNVIEANAHLIAAAPRMYGILSELTDWVRHAGTPPNNIVAHARLILAEARGEIETVRA
jgi:hypothetical protein